MEHHEIQINTSDRQISVNSTSKLALKDDYSSRKDFQVPTGNGARDKSASSQRQVSIKSESSQHQVKVKSASSQRQVSVKSVSIQC